jgi:hypothetical protein
MRALAAEEIIVANYSIRAGARHPMKTVSGGDAFDFLINCVEFLLASRRVMTKHGYKNQIGGRCGICGAAATLQRARYSLGIHARLRGAVGSISRGENKFTSDGANLRAGKQLRLFLTPREKKKRGYSNAKWNSREVATENNR